MLFIGNLNLISVQSWTYIGSHGKLYFVLSDLRQLFISLAFRECRKDCNILKVIRVPGVESIKS